MLENFHVFDLVAAREVFPKNAYKVVRLAGYTSTKLEVSGNAQYCILPCRSQMHRHSDEH